MGKETPKFVDKPWGHEEIFAVRDRYVGKILFIRAGESLSLQYHEQKEETLRVLDGTVRFTAGETVQQLVAHDLESGAVFHVPPGCLHRMEALTDCRLLEVSTPELDDVVRLEDRYGREGTSDP
jgi:mannose-6-phosphate isomerase-like protein (cupin superfamily)